MGTQLKGRFQTRAGNGTHLGFLGAYVGGSVKTRLF